MNSSVIQGCFPNGFRQPVPPRPAPMTPPVAQRATMPRGAAFPPPRPVVHHQQQPVVQRFGAGTATRLPETMASAASRSIGQPLQRAVRQMMESMFRTSFTDVRVHVGPHVAAMGAISFTQGSNIHFAPGQYAPENGPGRQRLAYELAHVVQQKSGRVRNPFGGGVAVVHDAGLEAEAQKFAQRAAIAPVAQPKNMQAESYLANKKALVLVKTAIDRVRQPQMSLQPTGRPVATHVQKAIQAHAPPHFPPPARIPVEANPIVQAKPAAVAQARFYELTAEGKLVFHWWPMTLRTAGWRKFTDLGTGEQSMKDGYGVWEYVAKKVKTPSCDAPPLGYDNFLRVGRRTAFHKNSPAKHAVFELNHVVFGLAGDFNAVGLARDTTPPNAINWVNEVVRLDRADARNFFDAATTAANSLTYDLFRQNCYTPVTGAITYLLNSNQHDAELCQQLGRMQTSLGNDNIGGCGVVVDTSDSNYIKTFKKNF